MYTTCSTSGEAICSLYFQFKKKRGIKKNGGFILVSDYVRRMVYGGYTGRFVVGRAGRGVIRRVWYLVENFRLPHVS